VVEVQIYSLTGQLLHSDYLREKGKEIVEQYEFSELQPGVYLFKIQVGKQVKVLKFVKV